MYIIPSVQAMAAMDAFFFDENFGNESDGEN
jgi:hypothetical protein